MPSGRQYEGQNEMSIQGQTDARIILVQSGEILLLGLDGTFGVLDEGETLTDLH